MVSPTKSCPHNCSCKWKGGKETAECERKNYNALPEGIPSTTQVLEIPHNNIQRIPALAFETVQLLNLQKISLMDCKLKEIDFKAFHGLTNLVEINLSENNLSSIPSEAFNSTPNLRHLDLHSNSLHTIDEFAFINIPSLINLDISRCDITTINSKAFNHLRLLQSLKIHGNKLSEMSSRLISSLRDLHEIKLHDNQWHCDCKLRGLQQWLSRNHEQQLKLTTCQSPGRIKDRYFSTLHKDDFACRPKILPGERKIHGIAGQNTSIWCPVAGLPSPSVSWFLKDAPIHNETIIGDSKAKASILENIYEKKGSQLILFGINEKDSGILIRCVASNVAGAASASFSLKVEKRISSLLEFSSEKIAAISSVILVIVAICFGVCTIVIRRKKTRSAVPVKSVSINGGNDSSGRLADIPYTTTSYTSGSVMVVTEDPDLVNTAGHGSEEQVDEDLPSDESRYNQKCINGHAVSLTASLDEDQDMQQHTRSTISCPQEIAMWAPERALAVLDSAAPEHVMHSSLHETNLPPACQALLASSGSQNSKQQPKSTVNRYSYLPNFAPDYNELYTFRQISDDPPFPESNTVTHYGTLPRSVKARSSAPEIIPGGGTPTLPRHSQMWHYGSEGAQLTQSISKIRNSNGIRSSTSTGVQGYNSTTGGAPANLLGHNNKICRITARDSPDEGYQEGADV